ncbi:MAG: cyclic nucleotide-binding domain-containing protein [Candidatus Sedimenticola sp. (ex Thyasira tokunagai)]
MTSLQRQSLDQCSLGCTQCDTNICCLGHGLSEEQLHSLRKVTRGHTPYQPGQTIYKIEDTFKSLYIIQSGTVKIETVSHEGTHLVDGFFFKGDLIGLEAIGDKRYRHDATALEETMVCELPFEQFESLCSFMPRLQHKVFMLLGQKIRNTNDTIVHGRYLSAEKRLLLFFETLCQKKIIQKTNNTACVRLPMSKGDIASYLGLRPESLSRALTKLQCSGLIRNHPKQIELLDVDSICQLGSRN